MSVLNTGVSFYRKTLKRLRPAHIALHRLMTHGVIPLMERAKGLKTMPDDPLWFRLELLTSRHEVETVAQMRQIAREGMIVLDVGAHVGYYARLCAELVGEGGHVYAFEPHPRTFGVLSGNIRGYRNITAVQVAVAETEGTAELYDYLMMSASGSLHYDETMRDLQKSQLGAADIAPRIANDFPVETFSVRTVPIDDYLASQGVSAVHLVKMDIEGAEIGALRGMKRTIAQSPDLRLVIEYNPQALRSFDFVPEDAFAEVLGMGFSRAQIINSDGTLTDITGDRDHLARLTAQLQQNMGVVNLLFTRQAD